MIRANFSIFAVVRYKSQGSRAAARPRPKTHRNARRALSPYFPISRSVAAGDGKIRVTWRGELCSWERNNPPGNPAALEGKLFRTKPLAAARIGESRGILPVGSRCRREVRAERL